MNCKLKASTLNEYLIRKVQLHICFHHPHRGWREDGVSSWGNWWGEIFTFYSRQQQPSLSALAAKSASERESRELVSEFIPTVVVLLAVCYSVVESSVSLFALRIAVVREKRTREKKNIQVLHCRGRREKITKKILKCFINFSFRRH